MHNTFYSNIHTTWTKRSTALKVPQDKPGQHIGRNDSDDPEDIRKQVKEQEEIRFLGYFRSPPCKLCGMDDHNMVKRTNESDEHYTEEYECPVSLNIGKYDRSIGTRIFEMSDERFLNYYGYNQEAIIEAYEKFTTIGAGSRIPTLQRQLRLQNLISLCSKEREICASTFKSMNKHIARGDDEDNDDDEGYITNQGQTALPQTSINESKPKSTESLNPNKSHDEDVEVNRFPKRARTEVDYNEDTPPLENELFEGCFDSLITHNEPGMGIGVIATKRIGRNVLLGEYTGTIKTLQEVIERTDLDPPYYIVATETADHFIDGEGDLGNILKYINHKCIDPNCRLVNLTPTRVGIQTRKTIQPNEKLNYNYNLVYPEGSVVRRIKCVCTPECQHYL